LQKVVCSEPMLQVAKIHAWLGLPAKGRSSGLSKAVAALTHLTSASTKLIFVGRQNLSWDECAHKGNDLVLPGHGQAISTPEQPHSTRWPGKVKGSLAWYGCSRECDNLVFPGQRQAIRAPEQPYRCPPLPGNLLRAPERQQLRLAQVIHWYQVCSKHVNYDSVTPMWAIHLNLLSTMLSAA